MTFAQRLFAAIIFGVTALASSAASASALYVTNYVPSTDLSANPWGVSILQVQGGVSVAESNSWRHGPLLFSENRDSVRGAIAVSGRIDVSGPVNHTYNLNGSSHVSAMCLMCIPYVLYATDGTTDGRYNYTIGPETIGSLTVGIWRADRDWNNGSLLFSVSPFLQTDERFGGITYDPLNQSLWVLATGATGTRFLELSMSGTLKSEFSSSLVGDGALAMDYDDNTLWWVPEGERANDQFYLTQFDRQGELLSYANITVAATPPIYGAEFNLESQAVPVPGVLSLLCLGLLCLGGARRRKG